MQKMCLCPRRNSNRNPLTFLSSPLLVSTPTAERTAGHVRGSASSRLAGEAGGEVALHDSLAILELPDRCGL